MNPDTLNSLITQIEGKVDMWNVKAEWAELKELAGWLESEKQLLGKAIIAYSERWDKNDDYESIAGGLILAAYILSWDDILERYQEKEAAMRYSELDTWLKEEKG